MKIVIYSSTFLPNIGGLENIMAGLADEFVAMGHQVVVYTATHQQNSSTALNYPVLVKNSNRQLNKAIASADIYLEANISLKNLLPGLLNRKKWWLVHHIQYDHQNSPLALLKNQLCKLAKNISVSNFIATKLPMPSIVINNFYDPIFTHTNLGNRDYDFVFLGRLVSDKGVDRFINAINATNNNYTCLIIGDGGDRTDLQALVKNYKLNDRIHFAGSLSGEVLVSALNSAKTMVIPSIWDEPFGVVALEGMACGCMIACSDKSGLREATGNNAFFFNPNDLSSIVKALEESLSFSPSDAYMHHVKQHLLNHSRSLIAKKYIAQFENSRL
jgi:glycogen(starch) synthase